MIDTSNFGPKDAKIIRENPGKDAYQLAELGLSNKAFERLTTGDYKEVSEEEAANETNTGNVQKEPEQVEPESKIVQPASVRKVQNSKVSHTLPGMYNSSGPGKSDKSGQLRIKSLATGKVSTLSTRAAQRLLKYPKEYQLA